MKVVPADIMGALFQHGAARSNDPHLHTHCVILNLARAHHDGKWRALHGHPLFSWQKAAGATYRAELAWLLRDRLGIEMEVHGDERQYTRVRGTPRDLVEEWSKRDIEIADTAARFGVSLQGNGALHGAIQRLTRNAKEHGIDPEHRHGDWIRQASQHIEDIPGFVESLTGGELGTHRGRQARHRQGTRRYPGSAHRTRVGLLLHRPRRARGQRRLRASLPRAAPENLGEGARGPQHRRAGQARHRLRRRRPARQHPALHRPRTPSRPSAPSTSSPRNSPGPSRFAISGDTVAARVRELKAAGYPIDDEQIAAMQAATRAGQIAIIEGAAGSGKTTTLRPIADLYRAQGHDIIATSVSWRVTLELGTDLGRALLVRRQAQRRRLQRPDPDRLPLRHRGRRGRPAFLAPGPGRS